MGTLIGLAGGLVTVALVLAAIGLAAFLAWVSS